MILYCQKFRHIDWAFTKWRHVLFFLCKTLRRVKPSESYRSQIFLSSYLFAISLRKLITIPATDDFNITKYQWKLYHAWTWIEVVTGVSVPSAEFHFKVICNCLVSVKDQRSHIDCTINCFARERFFQIVEIHYTQWLREVEVANDQYEHLSNMRRLIVRLKLVFGTGEFLLHSSCSLPKSLRENFRRALTLRDHCRGYLKLNSHELLTNLVKTWCWFKCFYVAVLLSLNNKWSREISFGWSGLKL